MSLINDVLKDLDQRRAPDRSVAPSAHPSTRSISPARHRQWIWWLSAAILTGVVLHSLTETRPVTPESLPLLAELTPARPALTPLAVTYMDEAELEPALIEPAMTEPATVESSGAAQLTAASSDGPTESPTEPATVEAAVPVAPPSISSDSDTPIAAESISTESTSAPATPGRIEIRRATQPASDRESALDAAKRAISRGQLPRAESMLIELVGQPGAESEAFILLATLHMDQDRTQQAISVLQDGLDRVANGAPIAAMLGRILLEADQADRAVAVLLAHAPLPAADPEFHLLLAATHHQADDHQAAARSYRTLIAIIPEPGAAWVGLGASLEALERPGDAIEAYRQALSGPNPRLVQFARQRLRVLEHLHGAPP